MAEPPEPLEVQMAILRTEVGFIKDHILNGHADHETRIRGLEQFRWVIVGSAAAVGGAAGAISRFL